ncbi:MAG: ribosome silencing factor [Candidatus Omnitrophica bacterium]|nr:ribosome silencing factor [Candidatus Omnitrophota bacterium]MDD5553032.1 ribosome silencing factor [Candidatus Omnitrophota bacterium]
MYRLRHRYVQNLREKITNTHKKFSLRKDKAEIETRKAALRIAAIAKSKKAKRVTVLDMREVSGFCDYFVIASGTSHRQVNAVALGIEEDLAKDRIKPLSKVNPNDESGWVVLDFGSIVAHIFYEPMREFYSLERLWSDAKKVRIPKSQGK